ncbi:ABC transporter ATP-binding protein [Phytohabitans suffuscus]|uniref:ABC transporter ATP-binding protein n=1 Tax=Phytohabitans suffuscus TaxID=624315 RepID=A0A6F8YE25_9ACTN|nr:ABC transporter ATP-binding protein [Phytohabitans suffuscus]BCB84228.1 ABC transporter ATP-binding protein [Phytohabitans suffuscus]
MDSRSALLEMRDVSVTVRGAGGEVPVLREVALDVGRGELVGVVGETGAGKSFTARAVLGLLPHGARRISGSVVFDGTELDTPRAYANLRGTRMGFVPQNPRLSLDPVFTVGSQLVAVIRRGRRMSRTHARKRGVALLTGLGVHEPERVMRSYAHQLSGGLCQRVCIAIALANDPELVIADEPTTGLDVTVQRQILDLLRSQLVRDGRGGLLITHDLGVIATWCDRVAVMYAGRVVAIGPVADVLREGHPYAHGLKGIAVALEQGVEPVAIPGTVPTPGDRIEGCAFAPRCAVATDLCRADDPAPRPYGDQLVRCHHPVADAQLPAVGHPTRSEEVEV